jgi:hypothetical protein
MKMNRVVIASAAAVIGFMLSASPALAGQNDRQNDHRRGSTSTHTAPARPSSQTAPQAVPRTQAAPAQPQSNASRTPQRVITPQSAPRVPQQAPRYEAPRQSTPQRFEAPRAQAAPQRFEAPRYTAPQRNEAPRYTVPQRYEAPRYDQRYAAPRYDRRGYGGHPSYQRYYSFRRHFSIGIGLFLGYPVAFPSWYSYPSASYGYSYGAPGYISAGSGYGAYGGVSLEIDPSNAEVFVDGNYAGVVAEFSPTEQPLTLSEGRHRLELRAQGFLSQTFDITVMAGQVLPLQGSMPYR